MSQPNAPKTEVLIIRGSEVGIGAKNDIIKKTGASACANAPVCNQSLYKFSINSASWIIYNLPEFKLIIFHVGNLLEPDTSARLYPVLNGKLSLLLQLMVVRLVAEGDALLPQLRQPLAVDLNAVGSGSRGVVPKDIAHVVEQPGGGQ